MSDIDVLTNKVDNLIRNSESDRADQKELNANLVRSIAEVSTAVAEIKTLQAEVNHQDDRINANHRELITLRERQYVISEKLSTVTTLTDDFKQVKRIVLTIIVATVLGGGYLTKKNSDAYNKSHDRLIHAIELQTLKGTKPVNP